MKVTYRNPGFEHSIASILLFQEDDTAPYWSGVLSHFYPQISDSKIKILKTDQRKDYIRSELENVWNSLSAEVDIKADLYNRHFGRYHGQIEDALSDAFGIDTRSVFNDLVGNITLNPICPRFLKEKCFDVFYKNSERGALGVSVHEIIHYVWFYVWNGHFKDSYSEYDTPSLKWILSEMAVESIMSDDRLASINPYYPRENGGCVYSYFQDMVIQNEPILDTLLKMYRENKITDYMERAYDFCLENESAIREHIKKSEQ